MTTTKQTTTKQTSTTTKTTTTTVVIPTTSAYQNVTVVPSKQQKPEDNLAAIISVPIVVFLIILIALIVVVIVRIRRKSGIPHQRFHDDIIENNQDSLGMNNQLYDFNLQPTGNSYAENTPSSQEGDNLKLSKNGNAYYAKPDSMMSDPSPNSFANPLYGNSNMETDAQQSEISLPNDRSTSTA